MKKHVFRLDKTQRKEFGKYWLVMSEIVFGSLVIKLFEPGASAFTFLSLATLIFGLLCSLFFAILGLRFSREDRK